jgi:DNA-binding NarL/FixJ family response regulator
MDTATDTREVPPTRSALGISVCSEEPELLVRICEALAGTGLAPSHRCGSLAAALDIRGNLDVDLIVFGASRMDSVPLAAVRSLSRSMSPVRVVCVCERSAPGDIRKALDAGASGFVLLSEIDEVIEPVLRVVSAGQVSVPALGAKEAGKRVLTSREKQVLALAVTGMSNAEIAGQLFLAESTVKSHLSSSFGKLGVASRNEAAALVLDPVRGPSLGLPARSANFP